MRFRLRRPIIQPSTGNSDCGYLCIAAALAVRGYPVLIESLKSFVGQTSRGLSIRQTRDALSACGFEASAIFFDKARIGSIPVPGLLLCDQGHWVLVLDRKGQQFEVFDPLSGWSWQKHPRLRRRGNGLAVSIANFQTAKIRIPAQQTDSAIHRLNRELVEAIKSKTVPLALATFIFAQIVVLALPLVSMWSANEAFGGLTLSSVGAASLAFVLLSFTNILLVLFGDLLYTKIRRFAESNIGSSIFSALQRKNFRWFEENPPAQIQHKISSIGAIVDFYSSLLRAVATAAVSLIAGIAVLFFVSPALILPGVLALFLSIAIDLLLERRQHNFISSQVGANQNYQRFVLETLSQFPMFVRQNATSGLKRRHRSLTRQRGIMQAKLQSFQSWRSGLTGLTKSAENLFFVMIAAYFMGAGEFAIGGFVAIGAYKDLLSGALSSLFRLGMDFRALAVHRMQAATLFESSEGIAEIFDVGRGKIAFSNVSFGYGSFEKPVLIGTSFEIGPEEVVVLRGRSGLGKSTIAKLILGQLEPTTGSVTIDGHPASGGMKGIASVFQFDSLITGSIRENLTLFDTSYEESELWNALKLAKLDTFVADLPMGLETPVGEGLGGLSGGQKQRLLIARALILKPKILVLDEATASLDVKTESEIFQALSGLSCTILAIAHRPEVLRAADRVLEVSEERGVYEVSLPKHKAPKQVV